MITIERSADYPLLTQIARHPAIYGRMCDDFSPPAVDYSVPEGESLIYLLAKVDGVALGFWLFVPQNAACYEVHTVLTPRMFGSPAREGATMAREWIWSNTACRRIFTIIPAHNRIALKFAKAAGMAEFGINEKSHLKDGKMIDQILLGMSKPEAL